MIEFYKSRKVKSPERAHSTDSGIDFFIPDYSNELIESINEKSFNALSSETNITISPGGRVLIPAGIHTNFPDGYMLEMANKSGISTKLGLVTGAKIIDSDYEGEIHISLINTSNNVIRLNYGQKIVQGILIKVELDMPKEVKSLKTLYKASKSERKDGGFGSSDTKEENK